MSIPYEVTVHRGQIPVDALCAACHVNMETLDEYAVLTEEGRVRGMRWGTVYCVPCARLLRETAILIDRP